MSHRLGTLAGRAVSRYWVLIALVVGWQLWVQLNDYSIVVAPRPAAVARDVFGHLGAYLPSVAWTIGLSALGLFLGLLIGTVLAVAVWLSSVASGLINPFAVIMQSVPVTAMIPLIISVVGFGEPAVLAVTSIISFFPAFVMVGAGLRSIPVATQDVFSVLGASRRAYLFRLALPTAAPNAFVAVRITSSGVILAAMLAEYLMGTHGLGVLFSNSISLVETARAWGAALVATVLAVVCFLTARRLERTAVARLT